MSFMVDIFQEFKPFFGYNKTNNPETEALHYLRKLGVIDIGSNSVRMVIFDGAARSPAYFFNEKILCGLGSDLVRSGKLHVAGRLRAISAIERFVNMAQAMEVPQLTLIATAAVRSASDGVLFCDEIRRKTGKEVNTIDGLEEARLSAQGVMLGWPGAYGLICDLGGSSMELAEINKGVVGKRSTSDLGPLILREMKGGKKNRKNHIQESMAELAKDMGPQLNRLFLVGGSWRAFARIDMLRTGYPLHVMHEYRISLSSVRKTIKFIETNDLEKFVKMWYYGCEN
jgi:exopolyphosphatase/guanosine-5'-triphosphate,3'-diphosphate pyrophosphatase